MDIKSWCRVHRLDRETRRVLKREGFSDVEQMRNVTEDDLRVTFQQRHQLTLLQFVQLRKALLDFQRGQTTTQHNLQETSLAEWSKYHGIDEETIRSLQGEGFTTTDQLKLVCPEDIRLALQASGKIPLQQCVVLREAISDTVGRDVHANGNAVTYEDSQKPQKLTTSGVCMNTGLSVVLPTDKQIKGKRLRLLVTGAEKSGKTSTISSILGWTLTVGDRSTAADEAPQLFTGKCNGRPVQVLEAVGWFSEARRTGEAAMVIAEAMELLGPGLDAILYTVDISSRYTEENTRLLANLRALFSDQLLLRRLIVVFTHEDRLEGRAVEDVLKTSPDRFRRVLKECGNRYVVFNNQYVNLLQDAGDKQSEQCAELLEHIDNVVAQTSLSPSLLLEDLHITDLTQSKIAKRLSKVERRSARKSPLVQAREQELRDKTRRVKNHRKDLEKRSSAMEQSRNDYEQSLRAVSGDLHQRLRLDSEGGDTKMA